jgi:hypothetical protein
MKIPCRIQALKYVKYGRNLKMSAGSYADVTLEADKGSNRYRTLRVTASNSTEIFTEKALENAIERGDFSIN